MVSKNSKKLQPYISDLVSYISWSLKKTINEFFTSKTNKKINAIHVLKKNMKHCVHIWMTVRSITGLKHLNTYTGKWEYKYVITSQGTKAIGPTSAAVGLRTAVQGPTVVDVGPMAFCALGFQENNLEDLDYRNKSWALYL